MDKFLRNDLLQEELSPFHLGLLNHCKALVKMSRDKMSKAYDDWDRYDQTYKGVILPNEDDKKAEKREEPTRMIVPLTYAQVQTFIAFCFGLFYQRDRVFELEGRGAEDAVPARAAEGLLERDLEHECFDAILYQFLLDLGRFGIGIIKTTWAHETVMVEKTIQQPGMSFLGFQIGGGQTTQTIPETKYLGNKLYNISPYRFFPDVRLPLRRFQEGEFVASEDEMSWVDLKQLEFEGTVVGLKFVPKITEKALENRGASRLNTVDVTANSTVPGGVGQSHKAVLITEIQVKIVPSEFMVDGRPLGPEEYPVKYLVWIANDARIIRCEPLNYAHGEFTYVLQEYSPDLHTLNNPGLADTIDQLQSTITWFINSHISSVRRTIQNQFAADTSVVNPEDILSRSPIIRVKSGAMMQGIDRVLKQLNITDVTGNHVNDAQMLQQLIMTTTGISENMLGQYFSGRRSATEARNVGSAAAGRLKVIAQLIFKGALMPMARQMISNLREGLDEQTFVRVLGQATDPMSYYSFNAISKDNLIGNYDIKFFDGTLPSERIFQAQTIQDLVTVLLQNPQVMVLLNYDINALINEMLILRNINHPERFKVQGQNQQAALLLQLAQQGQMNANPNPGGTLQGTPSEGTGPVVGGAD